MRGPLSETEVKGEGRGEIGDGCAFIRLRTTTTRIRRDADEERKDQDPKLWTQINLCVSILACASVQAYNARAHGLLTRVRSCHLKVLSHSTETVPVGARPCDGDVNGYL